MQVHMRYKRSTKGTHVFEEVNEANELVDSAQASIPSLYIRKTALANPVQYITVTVEIVD